MLKKFGHLLILLFSVFFLFACSVPSQSVRGDASSEEQVSVDQESETQDLHALLVIAVDQGDADEVEHLVKAGADLAQFDDEGHSVLHRSILENRLKMLVELLDLKADPNQDSRYGMPPLIMATRAGYQDIVAQLLSSGAVIDGLDSGGRTALMEGARYRHPEVVAFLLSSGANVNARAENGWTALMAAAYRGQAESVSAMIALGADVNASRLDSGKSVLMWGALSGNVAVVQQLLAAGADSQAISKEGKTALDYAKQKDHQEVVVILEQL